MWGLSYNMMEAQKVCADLHWLWVEPTHWQQHKGEQHSTMEDEHVNLPKQLVLWHTDC